ncbi:kinesin, putative [Trypanosoma brucei gambiense DAL972]|uniref:Kinesin-like protein n=2 Tax=Trypanosoma brucei TaxID=5691 RepID=C9ZQI8_TRYB9|nr:kinesin, putative [Trypanosoma brucei gambiense DAL972]RHW71820.1 kinesin [Trypanosoma brucei equiperdum]CBH11668.1 kinesin, putative [Trypanosoma brucei gambiense DAL972]|eukprot:XP_011773953.1 kinesin, putative [Trypanosoma brucei gambiense DAL972]
MAKPLSGKAAPKNISVFLRVRPPVPRELKGGTFNNLVCDPSDPQRVTITRGGSARKGTKSFLFNRVFDPECTQQTIYNEVARGAVDAAFDGQHGVLFVYGQTGSGKTFTISNNDPEKPGVLQQSLRDIWDRFQADTEYDYSCTVSYVQLYNEMLTDLLDPQGGRVRIQLGPEGRGDVVLVTEASGASIERKVESYEDCLKYFYEGMDRKEMTSTKMNNTSSRSHTVFNFNLTRSAKVKTVDLSSAKANNEPVIALQGRLVVCDLAGSERASRTNAEGKTLDEATHINGSLLVLGKVVAALTESGSQHAPFRESKLTRILQYSLLGNGNTSIVVNCSPCDDSTEETLGAIMFGQRAIQIKQDAKRHEILDYKALYYQLLADLDSKNDRTLETALSEERTAYEDRIRVLEERIKILTSENDMLRRESSQLGGTGPVSGTSTASGAAAAVVMGGDDANDWRSLTMKMRRAIEKLDADLKRTDKERVELAQFLALEKNKVNVLAQKLRAESLKHIMENKELTQRVTELSIDNAKLKGTDYISFQPSAACEDALPLSLDSPRRGTPSSGLSQSINVGDAYLQEQLDKANRQLRVLNEERVELIVYQMMASKAIRLLHAEKTSLANHLEKLKA